MKSYRKRFRLAAKNLFLTYPFCSEDGLVSLSSELIYDSLTQIFGELKSVVITLEEGLSGYSHYHVYLELFKACDITSQSRLDISGIHGNYQTVRNKRSVLSYVSKTQPVYQKNIDVRYEIYKQMKSPFERFVYRCRYFDQDPRKLLSQVLDDALPYNEDLFEMYIDYHRIPARYDRYIERVSPLLPVKNKPLSISYHLFDQISGWFRVSDQKTLFLSGPSGYYKTTLILQLFSYNALVIRHKDQMKKFTDRYQSIVLDDYSFNKYSREDCINLLDMDVPLQFDVKSSMVTISTSVKRVIVSNYAPSVLFPYYDEAIMRRIFWIDLSVCSCLPIVPSDAISYDLLDDYIDLSSLDF